MTDGGEDTAADEPNPLAPDSAAASTTAVEPAAWLIPGSQNDYDMAVGPAEYEIQLKDWVALVRADRVDTLVMEVLSDFTDELSIKLQEWAETRMAATDEEQLHDLIRDTEREVRQRLQEEMSE